tara:strand:+ start:3463 stop:4593 length:1131 start_codon:yes stop_codon:yes gene_type:complete
MWSIENILSKLGFGQLNPLVETKTVYVDQQRSTSTSTMNMALRAYYDKNCLVNKDEFYGVVVHQLERTNPSHSNKNSWTHQGNDESTAGYPVYKVYIPELECRPEPDSYEDPIIGTYKEIPVAYDLSMSPGLGAIVKVRYGDLANMDFPEIVSIEGAIAGAAIPTFRVGLGGAFAAGDATATGGDFTGGTPAPAPVAPAEVLKQAQCYETQEIPRKEANAEKLASLHQDFQPYAKLFICECAKRGIEIKLTSGYRSPDKQRRILANWKKKGGKGPKPAPPGRSYHNVGMAFDFNAYLPDGKQLMSKSSRKRWNDSGIVAIGEAIGLYWGGHFSTNYDPIHWDFRNTVPKSAKNTFYKAAIAAGNAPNRHPRTVATA